MAETTFSARCATEDRDVVKACVEAHGDTGAEGMAALAVMVRRQGLRERSAEAVPLLDLLDELYGRLYDVAAALVTQCGERVAQAEEGAGRRVAAAEGRLDELDKKAKDAIAASEASARDAARDRERFDSLQSELEKLGGELAGTKKALSEAREVAASAEEASKAERAAANEAKAGYADALRLAAAAKDEAAAAREAEAEARSELRDVRRDAAEAARIAELEGKGADDKLRSLEEAATRLEGRAATLDEQLEKGNVRVSGLQAKLAAERAKSVGLERQVEMLSGLVGGDVGGRPDSRLAEAAVASN